jgi:hypothetical protein
VRIDVAAADVEPAAAAEVPSEVGAHLVQALALARGIGTLNLRAEVADIEHAVVVTAVVVRAADAVVAGIAVVEGPDLEGNLTRVVDRVRVDYWRADRDQRRAGAVGRIRRRFRDRMVAVERQCEARGDFPLGVEAVGLDLGSRRAELLLETDVLRAGIPPGT